MEDVLSRPSSGKYIYDGVERDAHKTIEYILGKDIQSARKLDEMEEWRKSYIKQPPTKESIEFARFKQDCRKRALDLAHAEINNGMAMKVNDGKPQKSVTELANEYYAWLIKEV